MCLILLKPPHVRLTEGLFKNVFNRNKDGFGYMYLDDKGIPTFDKMVPKQWEEAWEMYKPHEARHIALHWRFKTAGKIDKDNAHPYVVKEKQILMMHNGGISGHYDTDKSDSWMFVEKTMGPLLDLFGKRHLEALKNDAFRRLVGGYIGSNSRLLFLTKNGFTGVNDFIKADDEYVEEIQGILFSNTYAWDNQYWFKRAIENEYNKGLVPNWRDRYSSTYSGSRYYSSHADYVKDQKNGKETTTEKSEEEIPEAREHGSSATTDAKTAKEGKEASGNGRHRGHANPHAPIVRPLNQHTLHLPKGRKGKAATVAEAKKEAAANKLLTKSAAGTLLAATKFALDEANSSSQPETRIEKDQPVLLIKPEKLSAEKIVEIANRTAGQTALLVNNDKSIMLPSDVSSQLSH